MAGSISLDPLAVRNKADWLWLAIQEQQTRIFERVPSGAPPSHVEVARLSNEFDAFIDAVVRLLLLAELTQAEVSGTSLLNDIATFNAASPHVREVRNTIQHFDAYSLGKGRRQEKHGEGISEVIFTKHPDELVVTYASLGVAINVTTSAASSLHSAIRAAVDNDARKDHAWDPPIA